MREVAKELIAENGKLIVVEAILAGFKERSRHEFRELAIEAGFKGINFICCVTLG